MNRQEFDIKYLNYLMFDKPIPYKNLLIYPAIMDDYLKFNTCVGCFLIDKNNVLKDNPSMMIKVIKMSYLDFLFWYAQYKEQNIIYLSCLFNLLAMCLKLESKRFFWMQDDNKHFVIGYKSEDDIDNTKFDFTINKEDLKSIKQIICYQNMIDLPEDDKRHPEIKRKMDEEIKLQMQDIKHPVTIEDKIDSLKIDQHMSYSEIGKLSIRKFNRLLLRADYRIKYEAMQNGKMSGMVTFEKEPESWMSNLTVYDSMYDGLIDYDEFKCKTGLKNDITVHKNLNNKEE